MAEPTLALLQKAVLKGLPDESDRWQEQARQLAYYQCRNARLIPRREAETHGDFNNRQKLTSKLTRKVITELGKGLYSPGPTRTLQGGEDGPYQQALAANRVNALLQHADRLAWLQGVFAIQAAPGGPAGVRLYPWRADEIAVWCRDDDPSDPWAVCTRSLFADRNQVRYQLWDQTEVRTYWTKPGDVSPLPDRSGRELTFDPAASGPHGLGVLPFVFAHNEPPVDRFWVEGLGRVLADTNHTLDVRLSDLDQSVATFTIPEKYGRNIGSATTLVHVPGQVMDLQSHTPDKDADVFFRQPDLQVESIWQHILNYANTTLQELDLPLSITPEMLSHPESGVAIVVRRMPLIDLWRGRRTQWAGVEADLARVVLAVQGRVWEREAVAAALEVDWPEIQLPLPTPERDTQDEWELKMGLKSLTTVCQERYGLTEKQAIERLRRIAGHRKLEEQILEPVDPESKGDDGEDDDDEDTEEK